MAEVTIEGRRYLIIRCARCGQPMLAQQADNNERNDAMEVCSSCTRAIWTDATDEVWG